MVEDGTTDISIVVSPYFCTSHQTTVCRHIHCRSCQRSTVGGVYAQEVVTVAVVLELMIRYEVLIQFFLSLKQSSDAQRVNTECLPAQVCVRAYVHVCFVVFKYAQIL